MTPRVAAILENRCQNPETDLLFAGGRKGQSKNRGCGPNPIEKVTNAHHAATSRAGVWSFRLYDLRHAFATDFVASGGDLLTLAAILGHEGLTMVKRYAHPTEQHQAAAMDRMQRFRNGETNVIPMRRAAG
jgi:integrase